MARGLVGLALAGLVAGACSSGTGKPGVSAAARSSVAVTHLTVAEPVVRSGTAAPGLAGDTQVVKPPEPADAVQVRAAMTDARILDAVAAAMREDAQFRDLSLGDLQHVRVGMLAVPNVDISPGAVEQDSSPNAAPSAPVRILVAVADHEYACETPSGMCEDHLVIDARTGTVVMMVFGGYGVSDGPGR